MKAYVNKANGTDVVNIKPCESLFSEKELNRCIDKFNNETRALEFTGGATYFITYSGKNKNVRLKSSSLDELMEMYKCAWKGKVIPERKCFFIPKK